MASLRQASAVVVLAAMAAYIVDKGMSMVSLTNKIYPSPISGGPAVTTIAALPPVSSSVIGVMRYHHHASMCCFATAPTQMPAALWMGFTQRSCTPLMPAAGSAAKRRAPSPEPSVPSESSDGFPLGKRKRTDEGRADDGGGGSSVDDRAQGLRDLAHAIRRFREAYERVEAAKLAHAAEMRRRMDFTQELESQRVQFFLNMQNPPAGDHHHRSVKIHFLPREIFLMNLCPTWWVPHPAPWGPQKPGVAHAFTIPLSRPFILTRVSTRAPLPSHGLFAIFIRMLLLLPSFSFILIYTYYQAAQFHFASRSSQFLRHRFGSEPPTGSGDGGLLPVSDFINNIIGSLAMQLHDAALDHYKPTRGEALPHQRHQASATPL